MRLEFTCPTCATVSIDPDVSERQTHIVCPNCKQRILLDRSAERPEPAKPPIAPRPTPPVPSAIQFPNEIYVRKRKGTLPMLSMSFFGIAGLVALGNGFLLSADEKSVMHQIYVMMNYMTGLACWGVVAIIAELER